MIDQTEKALEAAKDAVGNVLGHHIAVWTNTQALRQVRAEREPALIFSLCNHPAPEPLNISNSLSHPFNHVKGDQVSDFLAIRSTLEILEASPEFIEAAAILDPLVENVRRLEAKLQDEIAERGAKLNALREVEAAARAKAEAALENDPTVKAARDAVAAVTPKPPAEPAPLVRGVIKTRPNLDATAEPANEIKNLVPSRAR